MLSLDFDVHGCCFLFVLFVLFEMPKVFMFFLCLFLAVAGRKIVLRVRFGCLFFIALNLGMMLHAGTLLWAARVPEGLTVNFRKVIEAIAILSHNRTLQACNGTLALALDHELALA